VSATPKTLRSRNETTAKRNLGLIADAVAQHQGLLKEGVVPESSFLAAVWKYEQARTALHVLKMLDEDQLGSEPGTTEVLTDDLAVLMELLRSSDVGYVIQEAGEGSPMDRLVQAARPAWEPEQEPG
jgi:hypothetical protein